MDASLAVFAARPAASNAWTSIVDRAPTPPTFPPEPTWASPELEAKFNEFVAGTFFKAMLAAMRKTVGGDAVIHGGRAEEIFRSHLDDTLARRAATERGDGFSEKLYRQFLLNHAANRDVTAAGDASNNAYRRAERDPVGRARDLLV